MSPLLQVAGMVTASGLAAGAVLARDLRARAVAMLCALAVTPALLLAHIWDSPQVEGLRDRGALALLLVAGAALVVAGLATFFARRPGWFGIAALAAVPFRVPIEAGGATANLLVPLYAVIGAGALAWAVPRVRAPSIEAREGENRTLEWLLAGAVVLYALQSAYSDDREKALEQVVFFYVPFALLFGLLREVTWDRQRLLTGFGVLAALALLFVAVGFWEYSARELLLNPKVISSNQFEPYFRVNSLFFDPNIYGRFLALVMLGLAALLLWSRTARETWVAAAGLALLWGGLVLTLSQSSFAALLAGLAVLALLRFRARWTLGALGAGVAVGAVLVLAAPGTLGVDQGLDEATSGRAGLIEGGARLAGERPVGGWGSGAFEHQYRRQEAVSAARAVTASHTIPVTVAAEQGVVGLAVYLALLAAALMRLVSGARGLPARAAIAAGFVALVAHTWMYAAFLEDPLTWTLLGIGVTLARR